MDIVKQAGCSLWKGEKIKHFILPTRAFPVQLQFNISKCAITILINQKGDTGRYEYAHEQKNLHFNCGLLFEFCTNEQNSLKIFSGYSIIGLISKKEYH